MTSIAPTNIIEFWRDAGPDRWFKKDEKFDREIADRFFGVHRDASSGALDHWAGSAEGSLALILVLDQFSRNLFRNSADAFASDFQALTHADEAVRQGFDRRFDIHLRCFVYLPFEHSERLSDQKRSVLLVHRLKNENYLHYARLHHDIIYRFGRFPHRNVVLGRHTSPAERAFLDDGGFSG